MRASVVVGIIALVLLPSQLAAQYGRQQAETLAGLNTVYVNYQEPQGELSAAANEEIVDVFTLELRKAGVRIARSIDEVATDQGVVKLAFIVNPGTLGQDQIILRMDVEQQARLVRTGEEYLMVTWFHEDTVKGFLNEGNIHRELALSAANRFLADWLDANNR